MPPITLSDLPWHVLAVIPLIVLAGYTVFGATGFGSSIVSVPLLAHFFPLVFVVPLITAVDAFAAASVSVRQRDHVAWPEFLRLLPAMLIGMTAGTTLMINLPHAPALLALGTFATLYGLYVLVGTRAMKRAPAWLAWPVGCVGGVFSALFGTGGPIYMMFLSARLQDKTALRATSAAVVATSVWIRLVLFAVAGLLLQSPLLILAACLLPIMVIGLTLGHRLHDRLTGAGVMRLIAALLVVNGASLVYRTLSNWTSE